MVRVYTNTYNEIFTQYQNISVPEYQRPYRWSIDKIEELLTDLEEFFIKKTNPHLEYYMGSILFLEGKDKFEIIDGQQRLTTLILLQYVIQGNLNSNQNLTFNSHVSFYNIKENISYLEKRRKLLIELYECNFIKKLRFTVIVSKDEDNAFAFFDSQNNRGVTLGADDYLKAYHLRATSENLQENLALEWEKIIFSSQNENKFEIGLSHLFYKILYRARKWRGQTQLIPEDKEVVLKTFQKQTITSPHKDYYELFASKINQKYATLSAQDDNLIQLNLKEVKNIEKINLPFSLRQPIFKGHNFFQYTVKYHSIYKLLFADFNISEISILEARKYYHDIYTENMSIFLRHYMQLCMIMYYDSFGGLEIDKAVKYFDYLIGSIRIDKYYVRKEAIKNNLIQCSNNLLDVIATAYVPQEIFNFISEQNYPKVIYENENLDNNENGVRTSYKKRVLNYFEKNSKTLKDRLLWIR